LSFSDLNPPAEGTWVEYVDDRRKLLLYGGPVTDPLGTLAKEGWEEFELLSTARALADAPGFVEGAPRTHLVPSDPVPDASAAIIDDVRSDRLAALGGGRVIDSAKAIRGGTRRRPRRDPNHALGRSMTAIHRLPTGREAGRGARPSLVIGYADAMTSAPEAAAARDSDERAGARGGVPLHAACG